MSEYRLERLVALLSEISEFNKADLSKIVLLRKGIKVHLDKQVIKEWRSTGMTNIDFITHEMYDVKGSIWD